MLRVNADAWCEWALIDTKVSLSLRSFSLLSLTKIPRGVLPLLPSYVPPKNCAQQESIPVGCVSPARQSYVLWWPSARGYNPSDKPNPLVYPQPPSEGTKHTDSPPPRKNSTQTRVKTVPSPVVASGNNAFNKEIPQDVEYHGHFLFQMGGNLITDCNGMLHLVYCSKTSKDRPNVFPYCGCTAGKQHIQILDLF